MTPLKKSVGNAETLFREMPISETGVDFTNRLFDENNVPYIYMGAGVAVGDVDDDGRVDIYLLSVDGPNRLYRQVADFKFEDVTESANVDGGAAWSRGATFFDADNDGDLDLYVCNTEAPNLLYVNQGDGTFVESANRLGADLVAASVMAGVADYDQDGDLDLYATTHRPLHHSVDTRQLMQMKLPANTRRSADDLALKYDFHTVGGKLTPTNKDDYFENHDHWEIAGQNDVLLQNNGDGSFRDATQSSGIGSDPGLGLSSTWLDFDGDGWLDLHVANDLQSKDRLYRNNRDGTFTESLEQMFPSTTWYSMGSDFGDINNDGLFDYLVVDMASTTHYRAKVQMGDMDRFRYFMEQERPAQLMRNALFLNTGTMRYQEVAQMVGLHASDWTWAVKINDLDNDGFVDVFFTNGIARADEMNPDLRRKRSQLARSGGSGELAKFVRDQGKDSTRNLAYRNNGRMAFDNVGASWGLDHQGISYGAAQADIDGDGDLDLIVNNHNEPATIYRNDSSNGNRAVFSFRGVESNRFGIGTTVKIRTENGVQVRQLFPNHGYMTCDEPILHFGLREADSISVAIVVWPNGSEQVFRDLPANHKFIVTEMNIDENERSTALAREPHFVDVTTSCGVDFQHNEYPYDDFGVQPLLPGKLSQLGPGIAWGDVNGDGRDDLFVGGAAGQSGGLYVARGNARFERESGPWAADKMCEDMAPLFFDVDSDGDQDLFVTSGSSEYDRGDDRLKNRLYINGQDVDGKFAFTKSEASPASALSESSGAVCAADFDADGDLDLFVGGRVVPGQYPIAATSQLLRNDEGVLVDVTADVAPVLVNVGLVTGAIWTDVDADGRSDLMVTLEWGPVKLFRNTGDGLVDFTRKAGLSSRTGWWNAIASGDFNSDGALDYVVMNVGLNTKYGDVTSVKPAVLYYGDMDNSGLPRLVEVKKNRGGMLPVRGLSCSSHAMPSLSEKFETFHSFAASSLTDIYRPECLDEAKRFEANTFRSGVLLNDGTGRFTWRPLPRMAQIAPAYGVHVADFDGDGNSDIYFVQNLFTREPETGVWGGGVSQLLLGDGTGSFEIVSPQDSGLIVTGDAKGLAVADLNGDAMPDMAVSQNDGPFLLFQNQGTASKARLAIRLLGPVGNPTGIGARVAVWHDGNVLCASEVGAGSGYLSQSTSDVFVAFAEDVSRESCRIVVLWPDGTEQSLDELPTSNRIVIKHAAR